MRDRGHAATWTRLCCAGNVSRPSSGIISLLGRGRADIPFDHFHTVLAEVVQRPVLVVGEQLHDPVGMLLAGGIEEEEGTA